MARHRRRDAGKTGTGLAAGLGGYLSKPIGIAVLTKEGE